MENADCGNFTTRLNTGGWFNGMCRTDMNVLYRVSQKKVMTVICITEM